MTYPINRWDIDLERVRAFGASARQELMQTIQQQNSVGTFALMLSLMLAAFSFHYGSTPKKRADIAWSNGIVTFKGMAGPLPGPLLSFKWPGEHRPTIAPWALKELERKNSVELEELMLAGVPRELKARARRLLPSLLSACERFGVDPFWAMSIMWTESHFRLNARSYAGAYGPMQIMPATAHYLLWKMGEQISFEEAARLRKIPSRNVDMGVAYLAELLEEFGGNYKLATIAYNMGPYGLKRALASGRTIGRNHRYWKRVIGHMKLLLDGAAPRLGPWRQFSEGALEKYAEQGHKFPLVGMAH